MSKTEKCYRIDSYEWLQPTGDASRLLVRYSIADNSQGDQNRQEAHIEVNLSETAIQVNHLEDSDEQVKAIVSFVKGQIEDALKEGKKLPSEMTITTYNADFSVNPDREELNIGRWHCVTIERKMGFLPS